MRGIGDAFIYEVKSHGKVLYNDSKPEEEMVKS